MSSESLSQNEIDLLFGGGGGDDPSSAGGADRVASGDVQVYDFRRPARISKDRKRSLTAMYGMVAKTMEGWITARVRGQIQMELQSVEQLTFGEFMLALPSPCASYIVEMGDSMGSQGVIDFGHEFAFFLVDRLLGGAGKIGVPDRPLTPLERLVVRIVSDRVVIQLQDVWKDYVRLDMGISGFESIPEMLQVANREDPVLVGNIEVTVQGTSSLLLLCLPFTPLEKFFTGSTERRVHSYHGPPEERETDRGNLEENLRLARLDVTACLPRFQVPVRKLVALKKGDVLTTGLDTRTPLELFVADQRRFRAESGRAGRTLAVRVTEPVSVEPDTIIEPGRQRIQP